MCCYKKICDNQDGHIAQCSLCGNIELRYKTSLVHFEQKLIDSFIHYIQSIIKDRANAGDDLYNIVLDLLQSYTLQMVVNMHDLYAILSLLEDADIFLKQQALLNLFKPAV